MGRTIKGIANKCFLNLEELCQLHARELEIWSGAAGAEDRAESVPMVVRPPGEGWLQPSPAMAPCRVAARFAFVLPGKSLSRTLCACICEYKAMVHLPGPKKAEMTARQELPEDGEGEPFPVRGVCSCPVSAIRSGPRVLQGLCDCHHTVCQGDAHWEWQTLWRSICSESAGAGMIKQTVL